MVDTQNETEKVGLRPALASDDPLLRRIYASTRAEEQAIFGWPEAQWSLFLQMQYDAQKRGYDVQFPAAEHSIILYGEREIGRLIINRAESEILLVDIALLPEFRGRAIGGALIKELQAEAARDGKAVRLNVVETNPARRLYERLGFVKVDDNGVYHDMLWRSEEAANG